MNRGKDPPRSLCEKRFTLEAIKENKVAPNNYKNSVKISCCNFVRHTALACKHSSTAFSMICRSIDICGGSAARVRCYLQMIDSNLLYCVPEQALESLIIV